MDIRKVAVIGGGSFGTVIANIIASNGYPVKFWMRSEEMARQVNSSRENPQYLPGHKLHDNVVATNDMVAAVADAELVFVAVPSGSFRSVLKDVMAHARPDVTLVSTTKGIEAGTFCLMSQILREEAPGAHIGVLSGPNLAKEIAANNIAGTVVASDDESVRNAVLEVLRSESFRVYTNDDMLGVELGGSLKNIYSFIQKDNIQYFVDRYLQLIPLRFLLPIGRTSNRI